MRKLPERDSRCTLTFVRVSCKLHCFKSGLQRWIFNEKRLRPRIRSTGVENPTPPRQPWLTLFLFYQNNDEYPWPAAAPDRREKFVPRSHTWNPAPWHLLWVTEEFEIHIARVCILKHTHTHTCAWGRPRSGIYHARVQRPWITLFFLSNNRIRLLSHGLKDSWFFFVTGVQVEWEGYRRLWGE